METPTITRGTLSNDEINVLSGMMIIFMHAAERCVRLMEQHYEAEYRAGADYKRICKALGRAKTDEIVRQQTKKIVRGDERNNIGRLLKLAADFENAMERLTLSGIRAHSEDTTEVQAFDAIIHDVDYLCYLYALMVNCNGKDDEIKITSALKALAKGDRVSDRLLNMFNQNINV